MSLLRRKADTPSIVADLAGASISGQVAIGENIVQIHAESGAIVNYAPPERRPVPRPRPAPVRMLPRDFPNLVGREPVLSLASTRLTGGQCVELSGATGIGKTSLLRRLAHRLSDDAMAPSSVLFTWCGSQPVGDLQQFVFESLFEFDGQLVPTPAQLRMHLQAQQALVILDDVAIDQADLERLMDSLPNGVFAYASQTRRMWGDGHAIELTGLDGEAAAALVERELGHRLNATEHAEALRLAAQLNGHPLAILRAAAGLRTRPTTAPSESPEDALLDVLAALPGTPIPTTDLAAVTGIGDAERELAALEARHLVEAHSPRYSVVGNAAERPGLDARRLREQLLRHFVDGGADPGEVDRRARRAEYVAPPILGLLAWAERERPPGDVLALVRAADGVLALGGRWGAWGIALEYGLRAARAAGDRAGEAWALHQLGSRALCLEDSVLATASLTSALALRESLGDERGAALTRHNLGLLGGGSDVPRHDGGGGPRSPLVVAGTILAVLVLAVGAGVAISSSDDAATPTPASTPPSSQPPASTGTATNEPPPAGTPPPAVPPPPPPSTTPPTTTTPTTTTPTTTTPATTPTTTTPATTTATDLPDLVIASVDANSDRIDVVINNAGRAVAEASKLGFTVTVPGSSNPPIADSRAVPPIDAGASTTVRILCGAGLLSSVPSSSGRFPVSFSADQGDVVRESNENNNDYPAVNAC